MKTINFHRFWAGSLVALASAGAIAAVPADEAKKLGTSLTSVGAEQAGNADKSIPEYSGGLTTAPAGYKKGAGIRPDPFVADTPLYKITAKNLEQYAGKLTLGTSELLKKYPAMRLDVYPTHRSVAYPKYVLDNTVKNATSVKTTDGGLGLEGTYAGIPFPIPKTGAEAIWNHLLRYQGETVHTRNDAVIVDSAGKAVLATTGESYTNYPYYDPKRSGMSDERDIAVRSKITYVAPARRNGEALLAQDYINPIQRPRKAWLYLPGQRRVKLAPDVGYDTPSATSAGMSTFDDTFMFNGAIDRYDWKLVGKREMIVPYNDYKLTYAKDPYAVTTPNHLNADFVRWELHRVWVVEATLKEGKRHIYTKRTFYLDEDSWFVVAADQYDARGQLFRASFAFMTPSYDQPAAAAQTVVYYDFNAGGYVLFAVNVGAYSPGLEYVEPLSETQWSSEALAGAGVR